jgi:hypothetical protein
MADAAEVADAPAIESHASPEVQKQAEDLGWIPPKRFGGAPDKFVDADEFIRRGNEVIPIIKKTNQSLREELIAQGDRYKALEQKLEEAHRAIEEIQERNVVETQRKVEAARAEVKAQLAEAMKEGDHAGAAELTEQLTKLNAAEREAAKPADKKAEAPAFEPEPWLVDWSSQNTWYGKDKRKTGLFNGVAQELRDQGETATGARFLNIVLAEMNKDNPAPELRGSKVEETRNGVGSGGGGGSRGKSYADLPADAKATCDADAKRFVGKGKRYENNAAWQKRFAELYFQE